MAFMSFMVRFAVAAHAAQRRAYSQHPRQTAGPEGPATEADAETFVSFVNFVVKSVRSTARAGRAPYN
jgi:hypothetical protein